MQGRLLRRIVMAAGDWSLLYCALFIMIRLSYGTAWASSWEAHLKPYSWIFLAWMIIFYSTYLYETRFFRFNIDTARAIMVTIAISLVATVAILYAFPPGLIHPRRDVILLAPIITTLLIAWRYLAYLILRNQIKTNLVFWGYPKEAKELKDFFSKHSHLGYNVIDTITRVPSDPEKLISKIKSEHVGLIVVHAVENDQHSTKQLFTLLSSNTVIISLEDFYERVLNKVAPAILTDTWFINNLENLSLDFYLFSKRVLDLFFSIIGISITIPLYPIIGALIKLDSRGPTFFKQERVGKNNKTYSVYKFRTMKALSLDGSAEQGKPIYATIDDERITKVGKFLRSFHIDELPQLFNILKGEMSLVGPRPIRPEFVAKLSQHIPYYNMRHLVKPGLTGWAQINYGYGITTQEEYAKLQYDIYYAKKQSLALDLAIILRTIKSIFSIRGR